MSRQQPALAELSVPRLSVDSVKMSSGLRFGQQEMVIQTQHRRHNRMYPGSGVSLSSLPPLQAEGAFWPSQTPPESCQFLEGN